MNIRKTLYEITYRAAWRAAFGFMFVGTVAVRAADAVRNVFRRRD